MCGLVPVVVVGGGMTTNHRRRGHVGGMVVVVVVVVAVYVVCVCVCLSTPRSVSLWLLAEESASLGSSP
ncbi:hypothetical protein ACET1Q_11670 [Escherichia coli]|uniref:hypothetical protein n=1 Tax=Escherichia coli TaxID=562 RepID=UPI0035A65A15